MVAVTGQTEAEVKHALAGLEAVIGLANSPRRFVMSGQPEALETAVMRLQGRSKAEHDAFEKGLTARPRKLGIEWLSVSAPYHSPAMGAALPQMQDRARQLGFTPDPSALRIPLIRFEKRRHLEGRRPL
jgi:malonyl CoA-acyl carrier protein transacylase